MFSMTKSRELDEEQSRYIDINKHHYGEDVKFGKCSVICPSHNWIHWLFISGQNMVLFNLMIVFFVGNC